MEYKTLDPEFVPDFSGINSVFNVDGDFSPNDVRLKLGSQPLSSLVNQYKENDVPLSYPPSSFDDIVPKDIQSSGENIAYLKYLQSNLKRDD